MRAINAQDIVGKRFGFLRVISYVGAGDTPYQHYYLCECQCGRRRKVLRTNLLRGHSRSCGCVRRGKLRKLYEEIEPGNLVAGLRWNSLHPLYKAWYNAQAMGLLGEGMSAQTFAQLALDAGWQIGMAVCRVDTSKPYVVGNFTVLAMQGKRKATGYRMGRLNRREGSPMQGCDLSVRQLAERLGVPWRSVSYALYICKVPLDQLDQFLDEHCKARRKHDEKV